jgi:hypothetical protein
MHLKQIFETCLSNIGGESSKDVHWYLNRRRKDISRQSFFENAAWAIWVTGMRRKSAETFLEDAVEKGFSWNFSTVGSWGDQHLQQLMGKLHKQSVPKRARQKWEAIHSIARELNTYPTEEDFCQSFFGGKMQSADLDETDVWVLLDKRLPFIGEENARLIIRNMGGEVIKYDRWLRTFLRYYKTSPCKLETQLQELSIPLGLFDIVIWAYCEQYVGRVSQFAQHFDKHFGDIVKN